MAISWDRSGDRRKLAGGSEFVLMTIWPLSIVAARFVAPSNLWHEQKDNGWRSEFFIIVTSTADFFKILTRTGYVTLIS